MSVSADRMFLQLQDGTMLSLRAVAGVIQVSSNGTDWVDLTAGVGGVASVTGAAAGIVDNTDPDNPIIAAQFGSDTTVQLPNSGSTLVNSLELVATLTDNTPASEDGQWLIKLVKAGTLATALKLVEDAETHVGDFLTFINDSDTGFVGAGNAIFIRCGGSVFGTWNSSGLRLAGIPLNMSAGGSSLTYNAGTGTTGVKPDTAAGNVDLGLSAGALATNATHGFPTIPSCAGTPNGTPTPTSGQIPLVVDTTNNKLYGFYGAAWHDLTGA